MKQYIYADNAATTKLDDSAFKAMLPWLSDEFGNASQKYAFARAPKKALEEAREIIADCINAEPDEVFFTSGGTEGDNWTIKGSALSDPDHRATITSAFEHHAVLRSCAAIERLGYPVAYLQPTHDGSITPKALRDTITTRTRLVSIMFANNEIGSIQPIQELCDVAHSYGAAFHTDAVQAVGHVPIDVKDLGIDFLSASAHKFNGPKGVGFLYIKKGAVLGSYADGGSQERNMRAGTENIASIVGMATALKNNCDEISRNQRHILSLEDRLIQNLNETGMPYVRNGGKNTLPGLLSLSFPGKDGEAILHRLDFKGICASTGAACNSNETEVSHVLRAIQTDEVLALGTIRISLGKMNTEEQVDTISAALESIICD